MAGTKVRAVAVPEDAMNAYNREALVQALFEEAGDALFLFDPDSDRLLDVNPTAERLSGFPRAELLKLPVAYLIRYGGQGGMTRLRLAAKRTMMFHSQEGYFLRTNQDGVWVPVNVTLARLHVKPKTLALITARDIREQQEAQARLRQMETELRQVMASVSDCLWSACIDAAGQWTYRYFSPVVEKMTGKPADFFLAGVQRFWSMVHPEDWPRWEKAHHRLQAGQPIHEEFRVVWDNGTERWLRESVMVKREVDGSLRLDGVLADITEKRQAEENTRRLLQEQAARQAAERSEARFRRLAESNLIGVSFSNASGKITYANDACLHLLGYTRDDIREGKLRWDALTVAEESGREELARLELQRKGVCTSYERECLRKDGSRVPVLWGAAFLDDSRQELVSFLVDLSERKRLEEELHQRVGQLAQADRSKDEFLAMLAHELRNPLAPVRNALQIMKQPGASGLILEKMRSMIERQVLHLARLVDDLLDVSRITRGKIQLRREPVHLAAVVGRAVETCQPLVEARRHQLTVSLPEASVRLEGDSTRLEQILTNLLNNAVKFTEEGGHIWLTAVREGAEIVLRVRDTGIGIAPEMLPRIFDLFVQAERRTDRSQGGLGIGLTLVRRLVEMHGGTVQASSPGLRKGSEFIVRLPVLAEVPRDNGVGMPGEAEPAPAFLSPSRILVVDDNADSAESLATLLRLGGHEVRVAYGGREALEIAQAEQPQIVLLDLGMPGMDGYEVARRLRQQPGMERVFLVAVTGWGQEEDRCRSSTAGFDQHLVKPVEPAALQKVLAHSKVTAPPSPV
jgi:PAS domain S-box-containing protein